MWTRHPGDEFSQEKATVRANTCHEVVDVAHDLEFTNSYIILKVMVSHQIWI